MINQQLLKQSIYPHNQMKQAAFVEQNKAALNYTKIEEMNTLEVGDILTGKIVQGQTGRPSLKLPNQVQLPVALKENIPMNQLLDFIIVDKSDGILQLKHHTSQQHLGVKDKVVQDFSLPNNEKMQACIQAFMEAELPLDKTELLKTYHLVNKFQLPLSVVMQVDRQLGIGANEFFNDLQRFIQQAPYEQLQQLKYTLFEDDQLTLTNQLSNGIKVLEKGYSEQSIKLPLILQQEIEITQPIDTGHKDLQKTIISYLKGQLTHLENGIDESRVTKWVSWIKEDFEKQFTISTKKELLEQSGKETTLYQSSEKILELLEDIEGLSVTDQGNKILEELKESAQTWSKLSEVGDYHQYPMFLNNQKQQAEIYFFKPHKKKATNKRDFYAVIALDFPAIKHIDIHVHQVEQSIELRIEVENEAVQKLFNQKSEALLQKISEQGYQLKNYSCLLKSKQYEEKNQYLESIEKISQNSVDAINIKV